MTITVLVNGAFGRMGQLAVKAVKDHYPILTLVGQIGREYDLKKSIKDSKAQVVIDFTSPQAVYENTKSILDSGCHPVIGTSGLKPKEVESLQKLAQELKLGGIIAPNFSLGAILLMKYAQAIAHYMPHVEIIEMHHDGKADSPSGSAMRTAQLLAEGSKELNLPEKALHENVAGSRGANYCRIPIHSVRLPGILACEQVIFGNVGETLTLTHNAIDRACFMPGVLFACEKVVGLNELVYGLEKIVKL